MNSHEMTASNVVDLIDRARKELAGAGYTGSVGAVETVPALVGNPAICQKSDQALANIHAFFDGKVLPQDAGKFVQSEIARLKNACPGKRVVVTESGWPHQGLTND